MSDVATRAVDAQMLLDNPVFKEMMTKIESDITKQWKDTEDVETREVIWHRIQALKHIDELLKRYINEALIEDAQKKEKRLKLV